MNKVRALSCSIFENKEIGNCSNHGISERYSKVFLICDSGNWEFDLDDVENLPENLVKVNVKKTFCGSPYIYLTPVSHPERGWMMGGCYVGTSDARFREQFGDCPLPLHDRYEGRW